MKLKLLKPLTLDWKCTREGCAINDDLKITLGPGEISMLQCACGSTLHVNDILALLGIALVDDEISISVEAEPT